MSEDISRNLTRYRDFQNYTQNWAFKPRFVIDDDGKLKKVPLPTLTAKEYNRFIGIKKPQLILPNEYFHPNGPAGSVRLSFPYTLAVLRNFGFWELQSRLAGVPFYAEDHRFQGLQLTTAIMRRFVREAKTRGQQTLLVLFPGPADLTYFRENGRWFYQGLIDELHREGLEPINFGETLIAYLEGPSH